MTVMKNVFFAEIHSFFFEGGVVSRRLKTGLSNMFMAFQMSGCGIAANRQSQIGGLNLSWEFLIGQDNNPTFLLQRHNYLRGDFFFFKQIKMTSGFNCLKWYRKGKKKHQQKDYKELTNCWIKI